MDARHSAGCERRARHIIVSFPRRALDGNTGARQTVDRGEREVFGLAVVPAEAREDTDVARDLLLHVHAGPILQRADLSHCRDVRRRCRQLGESHSLSVISGVRVIGVTQQSDGSRMIGDRISPLHFKGIALIPE